MAVFALTGSHSKKNNYHFKFLLILISVYLDEVIRISSLLHCCSSLASENNDITYLHNYLKLKEDHNLTHELPLFPGASTGSCQIPGNILQ